MENYRDTEVYKTSRIKIEMRNLILEQLVWCKSYRRMNRKEKCPLHKEATVMIVKLNANSVPYKLDVLISAFPNPI